MIQLINYFLEANLCLLVFALFYVIVLRQETDFRVQRIYLIGSALASLLLPLLHINFSLVDVNTNTITQEVSSLVLPELVVSNSNAVASGSEPSWSWPLLISVMYLLIMTSKLAITIYQIFQILHFKWVRKSWEVKYKGYILIPTAGQWPTFTFFNLLFFDDTIALSDEEKKEIILHELAHIRQHHSWDIVLMELLKAVFWINPVTWWMRRNIQTVHEYLADKEVIKYTDAGSYTQLLAKMTLNQMSLPLGNYFNKSLTLKRITMMSQKKKTIQAWKWMSLVTMFSFLFIIISCNDNGVQETLETAAQMEVPEELRRDLKALQDKHPDAEFFYVEIDEKNEEQLQRVREKYPNSIGFIKRHKERGVVGLIVSKNIPIQIIPDKDGVHTIVDEPASPQGGYGAFYEELAGLLQYPEEAKNAGIEGKVYVQFIVNTDGSLSDFEVLKGIGHGCGEAAVKAMSQIKPFIPPVHQGKRVKQKIVLPISFQLGTE